MVVRPPLPSSEDCTIRARLISIVASNICDAERATIHSFNTIQINFAAATQIPLQMKLL
jgi:hypothetical protein